VMADPATETMGGGLKLDFAHSVAISPRVAGLGWIATFANPMANRLDRAETGPSLPGRVAALPRRSSPGRELCHFP
jgi:hypothetical protein